MTKDDVLDKLYELSDMPEYKNIELLNILEEFFSQNVVIPRGENRHPYADVLHEWIEGAEIEWHSVDLDKNKVTRGVWYSEEGGISIRRPFSEYVQYRIKPSEPVYEYQYLINGKVSSLEFWTLNEFWDVHSSIDDIEAHPIVGTKRVRT